MADKPNVVFVFGDQWRAQATGYAGDPNVKTPNLDRFADRAVQFTGAVSGCPVCCPWRATFLTGQYPLTHGVFVNDVPIRGEPEYLAESFRDAGYDTGYIGKWHADGFGRSVFIPRERRKGFEFWKARECCHDYDRSLYYADGPEPLWWEGYDAIAQTRAACDYLRSRDGSKPFFLVVSWGPPHDPYETAPEEFRRLYDPSAIRLRPNVPESVADSAREWLSGYYAHCSALDACFGEIERTIRETGVEDETLLVFTSDHGDMLGSHGFRNKQLPYDESIRVPLLLRYPSVLGDEGKTTSVPFNSPDWMPTLLGLSGIPIPDTVEGHDYSPYLRGESDPPDDAALIELPACFHQYAYYDGAREWRGLRTARHTYVIDRDGPWMLFDDEADPYQLDNLANRPEHASLQDMLRRELWDRLIKRGDSFRDGRELIAEAGYPVDERGDPVYFP